MAYLLHIETTAKNCSVCISENDKIIIIKEEYNENYSHAEQLHLFINEIIKEAGLSLASINAISISKGPGSYTGLRIGTSTAKGLAYGNDIPIIAINTLKTLATPHKDYDGIIAPMIDARRMEVYTQLFDENLNELNQTEAVIIDEHLWEDIEEKILLVGNGAQKCKSISFLNPKIKIEDSPTPFTSKNLVVHAFKAFQNKDFVDTAYFEPFYLKSFQAGVPKKMF